MSSGGKRAPDGRFVNKTGDAVLAPRKPQPRDEHGNFIAKEKVQSSKPYSRAVRELLDAKERSIPEGWDNTNLTEAQLLAMIHLSMAKAGDKQIGLQIIDRAEGKVPQAEEDRQAVMKAGTGVRMLAELLGLDMGSVVDAEVVEEPCLPDVSVIPSLPSESASASDSSYSRLDTSVTSSPESYLPPVSDGTSEDGE